MPQGADYIFSIQNKDRLFYGLDDAGEVVLSTRPYLMNFSPIGWSEIAIQNVRNVLYKGVDRSVSISLGYVEDAAKILKWIFYNKGTNERVFLLIGSQRLDYEPFDPIGTITGATNFTVNVDNTGTITIPAGQTGYAKITINSANTDDIVYGYMNVGVAPTYVSVGGADPATKVIEIPEGSQDFNLFFYDTSGGVSTAKIEMSSSTGSAHGNYGFWHKLIYRGEVDWSTFDHFGETVKCATLEDGLPKFLKANEKTVQEYPMDMAEFVKLDGINLHEKLKYINIDGVDIRLGGSMTPCEFISNDGNSVGVNHASEQLLYVPPGSDLYKEGQYNYIINNFSDDPVTFHFEGTIEYICTARTASSAFLRFWVATAKNGVSVSNAIIASGENPLLGVTYTKPISFDVTLNKGEYCFIYDASTFIGTEVIYQFTPNSKFEVTFLSRQPETYVRFFRPQYLFSQLINSITEGEYQAAFSAFFEANKTKVITCGNALRGLVDARMKISWAEFFKFWDSIYSVGITDKLNKTVDFAEEKDLINFTKYIQLLEPGAKSFRVTVMKELLYNEVEIGFPELSNEVGVLNGKQEFNTKSVFSSPANTSPIRIDSVSPISASCYEIELIRTTTFEKPTTDYKSDNKNYALHIDDVLVPASGDVPEHYSLDRTLNPLVTAGLVEPETVFNLWFTPMRSFLRKGYHFRGRFYKGDSIVMAFKTSDQNKDLVCDGIVEAANILVGSLTAPLGLPLQFNMEVPIDEDIISMMDLDPLQVYKFPFQGEDYVGIIEKVSVSSSSNKAQNILLRAAAVNDMTTLIEYNG